MNQTQLYLQKTAAIQAASRHLLRTRQLRKQAGLFSKSYEKPGWENDEDAVNDFAKDYEFNRVWGPVLKDKIIPQVNKVYAENPTRAHETMIRFNAVPRILRHSDASAALVDKYLNLWGDNYDPSYKPILYKQDRAEALEDIHRDLWENINLLPKNKQQEAIKLRDEINSYLGKLYPKDLEDLEAGKYSRRAMKEPLTRKDVGSIADATPKQLETWNRQAKKSPLWETIWPMLVGAGTGAGLSLATPPTSKGEKLNPILGTIGGGLIGGAYGLVRGANTAEKKRYAEKRLNEK